MKIKNKKQENSGNVTFLKLRFGMKDRLVIYEKLQSFTMEGFPIYDSLLKFRDRFKENKDYKEKILNIWLENIKNGKSFSQAIAGWVPDAEANLIAAGEIGKGIDKGLAEAIKFANSAQEIKAAIKAGSVYPIVLLLVVMAFIAMFSLQSAPVYLKILPLERWPDMGQYLYAMSTFIVSYWMAGAILIAVTSVVISMTIDKWVGSTRSIFDKFPPWSIYKVYQSSSFLIALASMMQSGTPLNDSLIKIRDTSPKWLRAYLDQMLNNLKKGGRNFGMHLNVGLLDKETAADVIDYSELGKFEEAVYTIGEKNLKKSVVDITNKMGAIKQIMIVVMGLTVGGIYYTSIDLNSTVADAASSQKPK